MRESQFFLFFIHPRPRTTVFFDFLLIRDLGQPIFLIFYPSEASDDCFFDFLLIRDLGLSRSNAFDTWHATENKKAVEFCLTFNPVEFGTIRIGIIQLFPNTEKLHRITVTEPVGEKGTPTLGT